MLGGFARDEAEMKYGSCRARAVLVPSLPKKPWLGQWDAGSQSARLSACKKIPSGCPKGLILTSQKTPPKVVRGTLRDVGFAVSEPPLPA